MWQLIEILRMASILQPLLIFALASSGGFAEDASGLVTSLNIMLKKTIRNPSLPGQPKHETQNYFLSPHQPRQSQQRQYAGRREQQH